MIELSIRRLAGGMWEFWAGHEHVMSSPNRMLMADELIGYVARHSEDQVIVTYDDQDSLTARAARARDSKEDATTVEGL